MLVLLPPSESKAPGGDGPPLDLDGLTFPRLRPRRNKLITALRSLSRNLPAARAALKISAAKDSEIIANREIRTAATTPALRRYTGVLYEALDLASMSRTERERAASRIVIASALFGVIGGGDPIPAYRLSAGSQLPAIGPLGAFWKQPLARALAGIDRPVLDLRSGAYAALAPMPEAIAVRVTTVRPDGTRTVVSHFNKATKGVLARIVAIADTEPEDAGGVIDLARAAGLRAEPAGPRAIEIVT